MAYATYTEVYNKSTNENAAGNTRARSICEGILEPFNEVATLKNMMAVVYYDCLYSELPAVAWKNRIDEEAPLWQLNDAGTAWVHRTEYHTNIFVAC